MNSDGAGGSGVCSVVMEGVFGSTRVVMVVVFDVVCDVGVVLMQWCGVMGGGG